MDTCELIRARCFAVLSAIPDLGVWAGPSGNEPACWRNRADLDLPMTPAILFLDGSEETLVETYGHAKPGIPHNLMRLRPQIVFVAPRAKTPENINIVATGFGAGLAVGPYLALWRARIVKAISDDVSNDDGVLRGLLGDDGQLEYLGHQTDFEIGATGKGGMLIETAMTYSFDPSDL